MSSRRKTPGQAALVAKLASEPATLAAGASRAFGAALLSCLLAMAPAVAKDKPARPAHPTPPAVLCATGQQVCQGPFGSTCFAPARGETCSQGLVCGIGQFACAGRYGQACFQPSRAESCTQGLVCQVGQSVCERGGAALCYSPARGETCG